MKLLNLFLLFLPYLALGQVVSVDKPELEEQRRFYEQHLTQKIEKSLNTLVRPDSYVLNVSVGLKRLEVESVGNANQEKQNQMARLETQKSFSGEEGLIPLSKLGVWSQANAPGEGPGAAPIAKRIRNFSELIGQIRVDLILDEDRIDQPKVRVVREVVGQLLTGRLPVSPLVSVRSMKLGTISQDTEDMKKKLMAELQEEVDRVKKEMQVDRQPAAAQKEPTMVEKAKDFKEVISTLIATLVLIIMGYYIVQRYVTLQEKRLQVEESIAIRQAAMDKGSSGDDSADERNSTFNIGTGNQEEAGGIERLKSMIENQPEKASYMIKQWLYIDDRETQGVLTYIPSVISFPALNKILDSLTENDRKVWNRINTLNDTQMSHAEADYILLQKVANHMIEPEAGLSSEIKEFIAGMTPQEAVTCIKTYPESGALLAMTMPSIQYTKVLSLVDPATIKQIASISGQMDSAQMLTISLKVQKILKEIRRRAQAQTSAFMEKVPEFIRDLGVTKESAIFESVAEMGQADYLVEVSKIFFPAELIPRLPQHIVRIALDSMDLKDRAQFIASQQSQRDFYLNCLGSGKIKEILMVEIDEIDLDDDRKANVKRSAPALMQKFVNRLRSKIHGDEALQDDVLPLIKQWTQELINRGTSNAA